MLGRHENQKDSIGIRRYTPGDVVRRRIGATLCSLGCLGILGWATFRMIRGSARLATGDFKHFYWASEAMRSGADPYASGLEGYIYPPLFAWAIQPLIELGRVGAERVWGAINMTLIVACVLLSVRIVATRLRGHRDWLTYAAVSLGALGLTFEPVRWEMEEGQTDTVMLASFVVGLALLDRFPVAAGAALALATQIKHQALLVFAYLLVRGRVLTAAAMAGGAALLALLPMTTMGFERWSDAMARAYGYLAAVAGGGQTPEGVNLHPITWELSVSVPSAIARAFAEPGPAGGDPVVPGAVVAGLVALAAAGVFAATWGIYKAHGVAMFRDPGAGWRFGKPERDRSGVVLLEWAGLIVAILVFSPQSMVRHSFILLPVHALVAYLIMVPKPGFNRWPLVVGTVIYQLGTRLPPGMEGFEDALRQWRSVGGASWCMLCMWFGLVWTGLGAIGAPYPEQVYPQKTDS